MDQPVRIWFVKGVLNERGTNFDWTWPEDEAVDGWAELIDAGGSYVESDSGPYEVFQLQIIVRWTAKVARTALASMAIQVKGEPNDASKPPSSEGPQPLYGGAWRVLGRSILEQADRRRFIQFTVSNRRAILT